jgi:hypothetical protein
MAVPKSDKDWEVDSAVDTLIRANDILNDKKLLPKIRQRFAEKQRALQETAAELKLETKVAAKQKEIRSK